jgi:hypothetical protein
MCTGLNNTKYARRDLQKKDDPATKDTLSQASCSHGHAKSTHARCIETRFKNNPTSYHWCSPSNQDKNQSNYHPDLYMNVEGHFYLAMILPGNYLYSELRG